GGAQIELKENSKLILNKSYLKKAQDSISLIKGSASFKIAKLAKNQKVNVYTPTAVVGVRGTEYDIQLASDGSLAVNVEKGDVQVGNDAGSKNVSADQSVETSIENPDLNLKDELKDMKDWAENKDAQVDKDPAGKVVAIKDNLDQANKSQKKVLEALSDDKNAEGEVDQFMFNQARSDGLFESASGIAGKHSKDKKVSRTMSTIKKIYSRLNRLNKILEEKFNKLDQIYEEKSKELDEKMNQFDDKFKDMDKKFDNFEK
ncbi:MAG: FecR domain-containing protein, partial [Spirochaetes bacterium]|nr:FecR domain-containing protein [Spirochaetota bacterium]